MTTIGKAGTILDLLGGRDGPAGLTELVQASGLTKPTTRRLLLSLMSHGLVHQNTAGGYELGVGLIDLAARTLTDADLAGSCGDVLDRLQTQVTGTVLLSGYSDHGLDALTHRSPPAVRFSPTSVPAEQLHAHASGKALLAFLHPSDTGRLVPAVLQQLTSRTATDHSALSAELRTIRERGYATEDEEAREGIRAIASPVLGFTGRPLGVVSVVAPVRLVALGELVRSARDLIAAADEMSSCFGGPSISTWESLA